MESTRRTLTLVVAVLGALAAAAVDGSAGPAATQDPKELTKQLLDSDAGKLLTSKCPARTGDGRPEAIAG